MPRIISIILLCNLISVSYAGPSGDSLNTRSPKFIRVYYQYGKVVSSNAFLKGTNLAGEPVVFTQAFSLEFGKQTTGTQAWQQNYGYPSFGGGISISDFFNPAELGTPVSLYGFFIGPFKRWERLSFNYEIGIGLTYNGKHYNPETNPLNFAIGSYFTTYIDLGWNLAFSLSKKLDLDLGLHFMHSSNGCVIEPNLGINMLVTRIAMRYNFSKRPAFIRHDIGPCRKNWEWLGQIGWGPKQIVYDTVPGGKIDYSKTANYQVFILNTAVLRQVSHKIKLGLGFELLYNGANNPGIAMDEGNKVRQHVPLNKNLLFSVYGSLELVIDRLSVFIQPGWYLARTTSYCSSPSFYQQLGMKYHLLKSRNLFAGISMRAYKFKAADFVDLNLGYRIRWR
jgi:hypothetical protein